MGHYLLTPWIIVLENLTGFQLVKIFAALYATRRFLPTFASARHLSLSNIEHLRIVVTGVGDGDTVFAAIIVGEVEKLLGMCEQIFGIRGVDIPEHNGRCSKAATVSPARSDP
jgi:hypothetical protein